MRDKGIGLPIGFNPKTVSSAGMQLSGILAAQMHGTVSFKVNGGTAALLRFPAQPSAKRGSGPLTSLPAQSE